MEPKVESIVSLFFDEKPVSYEIKNTSHGENDFREALIVQLESGVKYVLKLADNDFTSEDRIRIWQRCSEDYRRLGYYTPAIISSKSGGFPTVRYQDHNCVVYAEEYSLYACADSSGRGLASSVHLTEILRMTAKVANLRSDYAVFPSGYCLFERFCPSDECDEVLQNAVEWYCYAQTLPSAFQPQVKRIWDEWNRNREALRTIYPKLPTSVFQADLNGSNTLCDENGNFVGIYDFNLCGRDVLLNYLFREMNWNEDEEELNRIKSALSIVGEEYAFSELEKTAAPMLYRCLKPLWYTKILRLKDAGDDCAAIQSCLDRTELALTRDLRLFA